jgi:hypothetical protein
MIVGNYFVMFSNRMGYFPKLFVVGLLFALGARASSETFYRCEQRDPYCATKYDTNHTMAIIEEVLQQPTRPSSSAVESFKEELQKGDLIKYKNNYGKFGIVIEREDEHIKLEISEIQKTKSPPITQLLMH